MRTTVLLDGQQISQSSLCLCLYTVYIGGEINKLQTSELSLCIV